jgi:hypothetical protein
MQTGFSQAQGRCSDTLVSIIPAIDSHQKRGAIHGGEAEIGVCYRKQFIMFNSVCDATEKSYAIDVFDKQEMNIDNSGLGSLAIFKDDPQAYDRHLGPNVSIISTDSVTTNLVELIDQPVWLVSFDGCRAAERTISNLKKAQPRIHLECVIVLDDILNHHQLGVIEGAITFLRTQPMLVQIAIGLNELFLVNLSFAERYRELFRGQAMKTNYPAEFCRDDVVALG